ncbi:alpha/beta hydrolase [Prevotella denticola]|uniref:alpha/beta hydrolase n=1 Tax=Prevotella denticola TaxID=28129 RepID=UPI001C5EA1F9|nr:alpha/beta hydrolase [Prevotella denticola]MBW4714087.1 alpha/beta hydrolase [Prevotella denticola]MBW4752211.1 alpha/beta hydrolase [Prevotella denticola]
MNRKNFFLLLWPLLLPLCASAQTGRPRRINIWQGTTVGKTVVMTSYLAEGKGNAAVIVCPGGSYLWHDMGGEGKDVGEWLQRNGISAFVLRYRTAGVGAFLTPYRYVFRGNRYPDALNDLLRAMQYVKAHSAELGIDASRVAAMGFSAGGHLVMSAAELLPREQRPWFVVPVYPVVTMTEACVHRRSRRALLGDSRLRSRQLRDLLSLERHVPADCPPVFLVNCKDDPVVDCRNSELLDSALTRQQVPHRYIQYQTGGHGFGASDHKGTAECRQWKEEFMAWFRRLEEGR